MQIQSSAPARHRLGMPFAVRDVEATALAVEAHGGKIVTPKAAIRGVGWIVKFLDTEGNLAAAVPCDPPAR